MRLTANGVMRRKRAVRGGGAGGVMCACITLLCLLDLAACAPTESYQKNEAGDRASAIRRVKRYPPKDAIQNKSDRDHGYIPPPQDSESMIPREVSFSRPEMMQHKSDLDHGYIPRTEDSLANTTDVKQTNHPVPSHGLDNTSISDSESMIPREGSFSRPEMMQHKSDLDHGYIPRTEDSLANTTDVKETNRPVPSPGLDNTSISDSGKQASIKSTQAVSIPETTTPASPNVTQAQKFSLKDTFYVFGFFFIAVLVLVLILLAVDRILCGRTTYNLDDARSARNDSSDRLLALSNTIV